MGKDLSPIEIYENLPHKNCGDCGVGTCMGFASKLLSKEKEIDDCPHTKPGQRHELKELLTPPVRPITVTEGDDGMTLGGEEVLYRHEKTYFNATALFIDVHDEMEEADLRERVQEISDYSQVRIGTTLTLDGVALRCKSGDPETFADAVEVAKEETEYPFLLCSMDPDCMEAGIDALGEQGGVIYRADRDNVDEMVPLAKENELPIVLGSDDLDELRNLSENALANGVQDIILDPVIDPYDIGGSVNRSLQIRRAAINEEEYFRYPILNVPASVYAADGHDDPAYWEATLATTMMNRWSDAMVLHSTEPWTLLPLITLRQNIYQDPREPAKVDAGLREIGEPDENSPVLLTTNFALTYYTVESDIKGSGDAWVLVADSGGLAVDVAVAGDKLNASVVDDLIDATLIEDKVNHRDMIVPGKAGKLSGQIEVATGWNVEVGPEDSSGIPTYLEDYEVETEAEAEA